MLDGATVFFIRLVQLDSSPPTHCGSYIRMQNTADARLVISGSGRPCHTAFEFGDACALARAGMQWEADFQRRYYLL
jgi:hypothetical protein